MKSLSLILGMLALCGAALLAPAARGHDGGHDAPAPASSGSSLPRVESSSDAFELVGQLSSGELSILIDRYASNEPVLNGKLEVQYKDLKALATFHADIGDYVINDARMLKALSAPGKHALVFTLLAGEESDLLEGTLEVGAAPHVHPTRPLWHYLGGAALLLSAIGGLLVLRRRAGGAQ